MAGKINKIGTSARLRIQQKDTKKIEEAYKATLLSILSSKNNELKPYIPAEQKELSIPEELARRESIKNTALEQDIALKGKTLNRLFYFLAAETVGIFLFTFFQATHWFEFRLDEWSFKLLIGATILQITYMLQVAVKHLFPNK